MIDLVLWIVLLVLGIIFIIILSDLAVIHATTLASLLGVSSLIIGVTLVSIGTDIGEIINSIISCYLGKGDIDVGDSVGSDLAQLTLIFGILPLACGSFKVKRKEIIIIGSCELLSLILIFTVLEKGYFTRLDAFFMMLSFLFYTLVSYNVTKSDKLEHVNLLLENNKKRSKRFHLLIALLALFGITISSYIIVTSINKISEFLNIHNYIISFFVLAIGTSLPELAVDITAIRKKEFNIAIGDIIGSCIVDSTISIAIGQFLFPQAITADLVIPTILYTFITACIVIFVVGYREKVDKKTGILLITLYLLSYVILPQVWLH
ncbi:MAG: sodium:calcium antiporter [Promethearchaeota archaeon]